MNAYKNFDGPQHIMNIKERAMEVGFTASCDDLTSHLLRTLIASKQQSNILELGTGVGYSTAWILDGMDKDSKLTTVELNEEFASIAKEYLGHDQRVNFVIQDGEEFIKDHIDYKYDFIFADTWPGKFNHIEEVLGMVKPGGIYLIDDLNLQANWPEGHSDKVIELITYLESRGDFYMSKLDCSTGLIIMTSKNIQRYI